MLGDWPHRLREAWADARLHRRAWVGEQRAYVELRIADAEGFEPRLREALEAVPGVAWVRINAALARVVIGLDGERLGVEPLLAAIDAVELEFGLGGPVGWEGRRAFPGDPEPLLRAAAEMAADVVVVGLGLGLRALRIPTVPAELDVAALTSLIEFVPSLRERIEQRIGPARAEVALHVASSLSQALLQGMTGPIVDAASRALRMREHAAQRDAWSTAEPTLGAVADDHPRAATTTRTRPGPAPRGPIEHYTSRALAATAGAFGFSFVASRDLASSTASVFGGVPKPALLGRDAFAADLGHALARHGTVVTDPCVLRSLDRIDAVVVPASLMRPRGVRVEAILAVNGFNERDARRNTMRLLDMAHPDALRDEGKWRIGPIDELRPRAATEIDAQLDQRVAALREPGGLVLGLEHRGELGALISLIPMPDPAIEGFVAAVRRAELQLICAGDVDEHDWLRPDRTVVAGDRLLESIRTLQRDGHGVALVSNGPTPALAAADLGVGLCDPDAPTPWGATVLCARGFADAETLIEAVHAAKIASQQAVYLAMVEAMSGLVLSVSGIRERTVRRVMMAANATALLAMANSVRLARSVRPARARAPSDPTPWHALEVDQVLERLSSSRAGLDPELARAKRRPPVVTPSAWSRFAEMAAEELANPLAPVLVAGAGLAALTGSLIDSAMIATVVGLNAGVGAVQRYRTDRAIGALDTSEVASVRVRRGGHELVIGLDELVVGDVVVLEAGDAVPADARIIEARGLELDESSLTGESLPVSKRVAPSFAAAVADRSSMVFEATSVAAGECLAVVTALGDESEVRRSEARARHAPETGVEARLDALTSFTAPIAALSGLVLMTSGLSLQRPPSEVISSGVSLAVAAVPEGLPLLATMAQLGAAHRLSLRGALVRNPRAVEALGRVNVLCADKTGTLTEGKIRLRFVSDGVRETELDELADDDRLRDVLRAALRASPSAELENLPHATDRALVEGAHAVGLHRRADDEGFERVSALPFEPGRGYHAVHGRLGEREGGPELISIKGAPERVIPRCTTIGPEAAALDPERRAALRAAAARLAGRGLRVLAVAERPLEARSRIADRHIAELRFCGFVAFADTVRDTAKQALDALRRAGVDVVMITGDHPHTAEAIAAELGLTAAGVEPGGTLTGAELERLDDAALDARIEHTLVFARVTPAQKVRIVESFQRRGRVVGMTGDGANDAPAIRLADVGIALGERATPAARRAADVVVTDERIETLVDAVLEGRALWRSVRDAVALLVGGNLGEIAFTVVGGLSEGRSPLNARQLLLVNLLTDTAPALAIALRRPPRTAPEQLLREGPEASLGAALDRDIAWRATVTAGATATAWWVARATGSRERADTVALLTLVGSQLGQTLAIGGRDPIVLAAGLGSTALLFGLVETPGVSQFFGSRPLGPIGLTLAVVASAAATGVSTIGPALGQRVVRWARARSWRPLQRRRS
ncbi:Calcium-transporting ATPase 1 [Enhygromyxa salina]|uniref:Calcium-transporting ATPase 1 n=1 Tax=Enhygromyxa salina TaxID=215803 RepID=A0A2S9XZX2_9BACT|nr:cation-transporting P-type ATPase [Enhygromyxa salina]PRP98270.1 Calcium-transporting ATPase 1 [Enhygromyxa salina]